MEFQVTTMPAKEQQCDCIVLGVFESDEMPEATASFDLAHGHILQPLLQQGDFTSKTGEVLLHHITDAAEAKVKRILLVGLGQQAELNRAKFRDALKACYATLKPLKCETVVSYLTALTLPETPSSWLQKQAVLLCHESRYQYDRFKQEKAPELALKTLFLALAQGEDLQEAQHAQSQADAMALGIRSYKDLANAPANHCTPTDIAEHAKALSKVYSSLSTKVLDEKAMRKLGMNVLLSVAQGSDEPAQFIELQYHGAEDKHAKPYVLVGKGITFDSGGTSLKPVAGMDEMKYDMCGAATVLGTLQAVAELKLPINVVGLIAATENLPGGKATKPGDVFTGMSGQSVEVLNTDAEGRLILSDALTYAERFEPQAVIDIATLTGAIIIALGHDISGLFANDQTVADDLNYAADQTFDHVHQMPVWDAYQDHLKSPFADMANIGKREASSIVAACFLSRFAKKYPWVHLDIAGTAWQSGATKGATGRPVPLLTQYLINAANTR